MVTKSNQIGKTSPRDSRQNKRVPGNLTEWVPGDLKATTPKRCALPLWYARVLHPLLLACLTSDAWPSAKGGLRKGALRISSKMLSESHRQPASRPKSRLRTNTQPTMPSPLSSNAPRPRWPLGSRGTCQRSVFHTEIQDVGGFPSRLNLTREGRDP